MTLSCRGMAVTVVNFGTRFPIPCPVDRDDTTALKLAYSNISFSLFHWVVNEKKTLRSYFVVYSFYTPVELPVLA